MDILFVLLKIAALLILLSIVYRLMPYKTVSARKPALSIFPKYKFKIEDEKSFAVKANELGFTQMGSNFARGKYWGDFHPSLVKLSIKSDGQTAFLHSPLVVILFDTGDLWKIANTLAEQVTK